MIYFIMFFNFCQYPNTIFFTFICFFIQNSLIFSQKSGVLSVSTNKNKNERIKCTTCGIFRFEGSICNKGGNFCNFFDIGCISLHFFPHFLLLPYDLLQKSRLPHLSGEDSRLDYNYFMIKYIPIFDFAGSSGTVIKDVSTRSCTVIILILYISIRT